MIEILVDIHEQKSGIAERLRSLGWTVQEKHLEVGDYLLGRTIGVERKTVSDFVSSLISRRLFTQLAQLQRVVQKPILVIEGAPEGLNRLHPHSVRGALVSIALKWSVPVMQSRDAEETTFLLDAMARQSTTAQYPSWQPKSLRLQKGVTTPIVIQARLLGQIPHIGFRSVGALVKRFGTLDGISAASERDLQQVPGIGSKRAAAIYHALHGAPGSDGLDAHVVISRSEITRP